MELLDSDYFPYEKCYKNLSVTSVYSVAEQLLCAGSAQRYFSSRKQVLSRRGLGNQFLIPTGRFEVVSYQPLHPG